MSHLAAQTLDLALARFPAALLPTGGPDALRAAAADLSPGAPLYFECRLAGDDRSVDLSQHLFEAEGGAPALANLARRREGEHWRRLARFADDWATEPDLAGLTEIGLEHDQAEDGGWVGAPAVFAAFRGDLLDGRAAGHRFIETVTPHNLPAWERLVAVVETAAAEGLVPGRMVGVMLSRDAQLRCMIRGLSPEPVRRFLERIGWPGAIEPLTLLLNEAPLRDPGTRLVLGFTPDLAADCGIEAIHPQGPAGDGGRLGLLDWLAGRGLADPDRIEAIAAWRGPLTPLEALAEWPEALIARDLAAGASGLDYFNRFLSHVKLNLAADGRVKPAKAYLGLAPMRWRPGGAHA